MRSRGSDGKIEHRLRRTVDEAAAAPDVTIVNTSSAEYHARQLVRDHQGRALGRVGGETRMSVIATIEQLEAIYGFPNDASTVKVADRVTPPYRALIDKSPFAALATGGPEGLDCSPRGDLPGFVRIHDEKTLMMPDRRGNNRCRFPAQHRARSRAWRCCS